MGRGEASTPDDPYGKINYVRFFTSMKAVQNPPTMLYICFM
jgi:hypothetical protein